MKKLERKMNYEAVETSTQPAIWKGRRGIVNVLICGVLGLVCAFLLFVYAERHVVMPACTAYGQSHGLSYLDFKVNLSNQYSTTRCLFKQADASELDVSFTDVAPFFTNLWVSLALALEFSVPLFIVLFGLARVGLHKLGV
jgi:magnesium-transporting ATPase (P-type)